MISGLKQLLQRAESYGELSDLLALVKIAHKDKMSDKTYRQCIRAHSKRATELRSPIEGRRGVQFV